MQSYPGGNSFPSFAYIPYIYISFVRVYATELFLNGWTDFDEIFCVCSGGFKNGLDLHFGC